MEEMMNPELSQYSTEIKVQFQRQPREYQEILQDISRQVPSLNVPNFRKASDIVTQDHSQTNGCPDKGAYENHGKLYIGNHPFHKWIDESVKLHWYEIGSAQSQGKDKDGSHKKYQDKKREQAHLETTISKLLTNRLRMEAPIASKITDKSSSKTSMIEITGAGDSFGGRSEKVRKKGNKS